MSRLGGASAGAGIRSPGARRKEARGRAPEDQRPHREDPEGHPGRSEEARRPAGEPPEEPRAHRFPGRVHERREIHPVQHPDPGAAIHVAQPLRDPRPAPAPRLLSGRPVLLPLGYGRLHPEAPDRARDVVPGHPGRGPRGRRHLPHHRRDEPPLPGAGRGRRRRPGPDRRHRRPDRPGLQQDRPPGRGRAGGPPPAELGPGSPNPLHLGHDGRRDRRT